ncbi:uncharacterized protein [Epargyreus clarus]|uniref:uncharacterized protein n=1 Tax=Epargyreus clarus TaxID=520877 RepID=UPI003C2CB253
MGDMFLNCPLCCNKAFDSKRSLAEHLSSEVLNLTCPVCNKQCRSVSHLVDHLNSDNCETTNNNNSDIENDGNAQISTEETENLLTASISHNGDEEVPADGVKLSPENNEVNKMYVELLGKPLMKPMPSQELKLVLEDGESRYVLLANNDSVQNLCTENTVVTKQNNDGTISLTTVKDPKQEEPVPSETESEKSQLEVYSCNTCGVSFTSVIEHIRNYHNDQDVVVEEPINETINMETVPVEFEPMNVEVPKTTVERLTLRRMITDNGDIVETPIIKEITEPAEQMAQIVKIDTVEKDRLNNTKRFVQVDKFCNSMIKNIKEEEKGGPHHKVVVKELVTSNGNKVKIYNCISCNLYEPTLTEFKSRPCKILKYQCTHCPVAYENSKSLCAHMKVHKSKPDLAFDSANITFECAVCSTVFPTSKSLKLHKRMHDPIKSRPIEPPVETREGQVVNEDKYLCVICNKLIPVEYKVIHQNSHKNTNKINCHICNKKFNSREYLEMHMNVHNLEKVVVGKQDKTLPYTCVYCNRKFARPHEKVKHERIHTGEKPHSCEICGKSFRVSYCLTLHMRTHTGARPYACQHCGKRFKAHSVYNHHLLTHSEVRAYKCPFCPKAFKTSVQLAGHKNSHTKPFSCQQCNRPFASLYAARVHMDDHAKKNSLKFSCRLCGASYARAFALKDHVRQAHQAHMDAADALSGLKEEEWLIQDCEEDEETIQPLHRDLNNDINELEMNADELIVS